MTVTDTIHIDALPEAVWATTVDVERWPEWTPTVTSVSRLGAGPLALGSVARIEQPGQPPSDWTVTDFVEGERFTWETHRTGLSMAATHELRPTASGTQNTLRVEASGWLARLLGPILRPLVGRALARENAGLKARCERAPEAG